ncbi:MAG: efflux transporter [bacterium]|nr:efflux transporter [bacterium]
MRSLVLLSVLLIGQAAAAESRRLTLADAISMALRVDPLVEEAHIGDDRARLAVLRAQLDRFSLKIDGSMQELWNKSNIGGASVYDCSGVDPMTQAVTTLSNVDPTTCAQNHGTSMLSADQSPSYWQGLTNVQANLNYYLFSGFRVEATVKRAQINERAALVQLRQQHKDTAIAVARAYWNVRRLANLRDVQQAALQRMIEAESVADARVRAGLASPIDRNRARQRKLVQTATLQDLTGQLAAALAQLGVTLGTHEPLELVDDPELPSQPPENPAQLVREALRTRPEIVNARLQVEAQRQTVRIARSSFYPQLTLFGLFQLGNNQINVSTGVRTTADQANPLNGISGSLTVGAQLSVNFFDTLNTFTATADARHQMRIAEQEARRFERLVDGDVRTAHANVLRLYARRAPLIVARDVAADNLEIVEARYRNGDALVIEYLDAEIDLANAELSLADVTAQLKAQWLELQAALGLIVGENEHG